MCKEGKNNIANKRFDILGVNVSVINMDDALRVIETAIKNKAKAYISVCPVSTIMSCQKNQVALESVNSATLVTPDGMPVVWLGKTKGHKNIKRVYGPDLMLKVCKVSSGKGYRNYFYGSRSSVLDRLSVNLKELFPDLNIAGKFSPSFDEAIVREDEVNIRMINASNSDILWVGLGSPKQDIWMRNHRDKLNVPVIIGVGAAFDFIAGTKKQAPAWMQKSGLEWFFRLVTEPKRLWKRYIFGNLKFLFLLLKESIKKRRVCER